MDEIKVGDRVRHKTEYNGWRALGTVIGFTSKGVPVVEWDEHERSAYPTGVVGPQVISTIDVIKPPVVEEGWMNLYKSTTYYAGRIYASLKGATGAGVMGTGLAGRIKITAHDGVLVSAELVKD